MNLSLDNPYGDVTIPRAKLRSAEDSTVIANPMTLDTAYNGTSNPYTQHPAKGEDQASNPPPYTVKEDAEVVGRCPAYCYRCRKK